MNQLMKDSVLRIGEVIQVEGRKVYVLVDKNKNTSDLLFEGNVIKNVSVGSYIEIRKGFQSIIGKIDGEKLSEDKIKNSDRIKISDKNKRIITISLSGYIDYSGKFIGGIRELPLIGNEAYILTEDKIQKIHMLTSFKTDLKINIASTDIEGIPITLPIDGLFNSHIAIFGNTGSGKSNTLAALYQALFEKIQNKTNSKFLFFDFNGEYIKDNCLTVNKKVYSLSTRKTKGVDKIPITFDELFNIETLSILVEAAEKTQRPFLERTLRLYKRVYKASNPFLYLKKIITNQIYDVLQMSNKDVAFKLLDYLEMIISDFANLNDDDRETLGKGLDFNNKYSQFMFDGAYIEPGETDKIDNTKFIKHVSNLKEGDYNLTKLNELLLFLHIQLVSDLHKYKVQNTHIYPVINRVRAKRNDIEKIFDINNENTFWNDSNVVIINLKDVNIDMRKTIPLLLAKELYAKHKKAGKEILNIIIDEAHNILSNESFRETTDWKDYRLETFEEIIKEGRKFGVFLTISSQRPNDISETIISQAHNYFIHQLINQRDLQTVGKAISYIDKVTEESIPTLPVGTCIFSGIATSMPLKLKIDELPDANKPDSRTIKFEDVMKVDGSLFSTAVEVISNETEV